MPAPRKALVCNNALAIGEETVRALELSALGVVVAISIRLRPASRMTLTMACFFTWLAATT